MQLTDEEWEFIGSHLPIGEYGPYPERLRQQFEGVVWRFKTGGQWREMPQESGAWSTVSNRFRHRAAVPAPRDAVGSVHQLSAPMPAP